MKTSIYCYLLVCMSMFSLQTVNGQTNSNEQKNDTTFVQNGDTLVSNKNFKLFVGQKLVIGVGSDINKLYKYVRFNSPFNWPSWLFKDLEINNNTDYQSDEQLRIAYKIREYFSVADTVIISKVVRKHSKKEGVTFYLIVNNKTIPFTKFRIFVPQAIVSKELILQDNN